jgi:hypothetical protein
MYLNSLYIQSYIKSDTATFDRLLWGEEFTQTNPDGKSLSRKEMLERFGKPRFEKIVYMYVKDVRVDFIDNDKAIISALNPDGMIVEGQLLEGVSKYKDTYVKRNGVWKCISAQIENVD